MKQKTILITGAGSGLGRATALFFAKQGWQIGCTDINADSASETLAMVKKIGSNGFASGCDVTKDADFNDLKQRVQAEWRSLHGVVNNAGAAALGKVESISMEDWDWMIDINLKGVIRGCRTFVPLFVEQGFGHVVNIASAAAIASVPGSSPYNVTKAAVVSLSETLQGEVSSRGVGVSVVMPTYFRTNLTTSFRASNPESLEFARKATEKAMDRSRFTAEDVAKAIFRGIEKNQLYIVPDAQAKFAFMLKRLAPQFFLRQVVRATPKIES